MHHRHQIIDRADLWSKYKNSSCNTTVIYVTSNTSGVELPTIPGSFFCWTSLIARNFFLFEGKKMYQIVIISTCCSYFCLAKPSKSNSFFIHQRLPRSNKNTPRACPFSGTSIFNIPWPFNSPYLGMSCPGLFVFGVIVIVILCFYFCFVVNCLF